LYDEAPAAAARPLVLLDVGTGLGDIPARARARARRRGVALVTLGVDSSEPLVRAARRPDFATVRADALRLPLADGSVDVAMCSQVLHHFDWADALLLLREMDRVARRRVIIADLRRSWLAAAGIWAASWVLRFHPVSRHDGVVSVMRGFTRGELRELIRAAVGRPPSVCHRLGFRLCASWEPAGAAAGASGIVGSAGTVQREANV
jgi:ubiquinone/menaquinone biosynthesis C-methylase UbiE